MRVPSRDGELPSSPLRYRELVPAQEAAGDEGEADLQPGVGRGAWERNQHHQVAARAGPGRASSTSPEWWWLPHCPRIVLLTAATRGTTSIF